MNNSIRNEIEELIKKLMVSHDENEVEETAEEYLKFIDSIRFIELMTAVESKYDIELESSDIVSENTKELNTFVLMIEKYIN